MCMIMIKKANIEINWKHLDKAYISNRDGFGMSWFDGEVKTFTTLVYTEFCLKLVELDDFEVMAHFRNKSVGKVNLTNAQPFLINNQAVAHNGTIWSLGDNKKSDSREFAEIITELPEGNARSKAIKAIIGEDRVSVMRKDGEIEIYGEWDEVDGTLYSSDYYKRERTTYRTTKFTEVDYYDWAGYEEDYDKYNYQEDEYEDDMKIIDEIYDTYEKTTVAVYGSLKQGSYNHDILRDSVFAGRGKSKAKFPMIDGGFPYLFDSEGEGHNVVVEVYEVSNSVLKRLDLLEGVSHGHYYRSQIEISLESQKQNSLENKTRNKNSLEIESSSSLEGETVVANVYFSCNTEDYIGKELIEEWV